MRIARVRQMTESAVDRLFAALLRWRERLPDRIVDLSIAGAVACLAVTAAAIGQQGSGRAADWLAYLVVGSASLALVWRRQAPVAVLMIALAAGLVFFGFDYPRAPALWPFVVALYTVAVSRPHRHSLLITIGS